MKNYFPLVPRLRTTALATKIDKHSRPDTGRPCRPRAFVRVLLIGLLLLQSSLFGLTGSSAAERDIRNKSQASPAAAFAAGNLAVLQAAASANNTTASIVELSPTTPGLNPVQTIAIDGTGANAVRFSGSATSTGYLATTNDGSLLAFNGANSTNTAANVNSLNPRGVGTLDGTGSFALQTTYTGTSGNQTRCSTSLNNTNWFIGDQGGLYTNGTAAASPSGNFRGVKSFGGTVYIAQASGTVTNIQVNTISAPSGGTLTGLPGLSNNSSHQDFYLISSGDNGSTFDVLYIVSATSNTAGVISKFSLVAGTWTANGTYTTAFGGFGLAAADNGAGAFLYVSTGLGALTANSVLKLSDTAGYNATINITTGDNVTLYTAPAGNIIKGVAFVPQSAGPAAPEIDVRGNTVPIPDGDISPIPGDFTDFGSTAVGGTFDRVFAIHNTGSANLTGGPITFSGTNMTEFSVFSAPTFPVLPGTSTNFTVRFTPAASGLRTATVNIPNNDSDEAAYDFAIQGTGLTSAAPTISESTVSPFINLSPAGPGTLSGVIGDTTDPAAMTGVDFTIDDTDTPVGSLVVTAASSNQAVVPDANLNLTGSGATRNLKITPTGTGYSTITVTVNDGGSSAAYIMNFAASTPPNNGPTTRWHTGKADASTAVAIDADYMFIADDEDQTIRLYDRDQSGLPLSSFDFTANLGLTDISGGLPREVDLEASAQVGSRIYWLASHSNSSSGANRPNRSRLFATDVTGSGAAATLSYVGRYDGLKTDLINWDNSNGHGLGAAFFGLQASAAVGVIPEQPDGGGFNIEGLVFAPGDTTAYVSFRAPISPASARTNALIVPVTNFTTLVSGNPTTGPATFGTPIQLNLGGRGIREIKKNSTGEYLIVAGTAGGPHDFRIYSWTGNPVDVPVLRIANLNGLNPESIVDVPVGLNAFAPEAAVNVQLISDNGDDVYYGDGVIAKDLPNDQLKKFRSDIVNVGLPVVTAANVSLSGRVVNTAGAGIPKARITISNASTGEQQTVVANPFGYFRFDDLAVGQTYIVEVRAKRYNFQPRVITLQDEITELDLIAEPK